MDLQCSQLPPSASSPVWPLLALTLALTFLVSTQQAIAGSRLADQRNVIFDRYTTEDGLSHAGVTAITQDQYGFMWIGTQEGLNRFDGYKFENFYHRDDIEGTISSHAIYEILRDRRGTIWVGTENGLNRLDERTKRFEVFDSHPRLSDSRVHTITEDSEGILWIGTDSGLSARKPSGEFVHFSSLDTLSVRRVFEDSQSNLWVATDQRGLLQFNRDQREFEPYGEIGVSRIRDIIEDNDGNIWISGLRGGLFLFNPSTGESMAFDSSTSNEIGLSTNRIRKLLKDKNGDIWVGTGGGLHLYDPETGQFSKYLHDDTDPHSLSDNNILDLYQDKGGVIWVGTFNGLSKFNSKIVAFPKFRSSANPGLKSDATTAFADGYADSVWLGTLGGLHKWDGETSSFSHFSTENSGLSDNRVMSLATSESQLWVGTMAQGLNLFEGEELIAVMQHDSLDPQSISSDAISSILIGDDNELWVGTYGSGVNLYIGGGRFKRYPEPDNQKGQFSDLRIMDTIIVDQELWIATDGGGVIVLDPVSGNTQIFAHSAEDPASISSNYTTTLLSHNGSVWIGTRDNGLNQFNLETQSFKSIGRTQGLASDYVYGILPAPSGELWISGGKGISVLNPETGAVQVYDSTHGLQGDDFNSGAYLKLADGTFLFGGNNGFNAFTPESIVRNNYIPPIQITKFLKFNKQIILERPIYLTKSLELNHQDSVFGFEFAAMDYTAPHKNRFRYRLEGFDRDWTEAETHQVTYTNLDPGNYRFSVQGSNNDGVWNEVGTYVDIIVHPPIWATWWAYAIYLAVGLVVLRQLLEANQARLQREAEKRYSERLQLYIESLEEATDTVLIADSNKDLLFANQSIKDILGVSARQAEGRSIMSLLFNNPDDAILAREGIKQSGRWHGEVLGTKDGEHITTDVTITAVKDDNQNETAFVSIARDITQRKKVEAELEAHRRNLQSLVDERTTALKHEIAENKAAQKELANSLEEKELLLKEVHHRVKNNMQVISSLLNIQAETVNDDRFSGLLGESQQRIKSMSLIHENLYQSDNLLEIDFEDYINMLANSLHRFYRLPDIIVSLDIQVFNVALDIETAVPCGLIINELISNAFKHAFKGRTGKGRITVLFDQTETEYILRISDDGNGLPEGFSLDTQSSMGTEIVVILTHQIDGNITFCNENRASFQIVFPKKDRIQQAAAGS